MNEHLCKKCMWYYMCLEKLLPKGRWREWNEGKRGLNSEIKKKIDSQAGREEDGQTDRRQIKGSGRNGWGQSVQLYWACSCTTQACPISCVTMPTRLIVNSFSLERSDERTRARLQGTQRMQRIPPVSCGHRSLGPPSVDSFSLSVHSEGARCKLCKFFVFRNLLFVSTKLQVSLKCWQHTRLIWQRKTSPPRNAAHSACVMPLQLDPLFGQCMRNIPNLITAVWV